MRSPGSRFAETVKAVSDRLTGFQVKIALIDLARMSASEFLRFALLLR